MANLFLLILKPRETLLRIKARPSWLATFLFLTATSIVVYVLMHPFLIRATLAHLPSTATIEEKEIIAKTLSGELSLRCAFLPIRLLIGWSSFALVLFAIAKSFNALEAVHLVKIFSLEVHSELANILAQLATLLHLFLHNDDITNITSLVPFSAAMFVRTDTLVSFSLLNSLNVFTLLYVALLTTGVSIQSGFSRAKSLLVVLLTWLTSLVFNIGALKLMQETMYLNL